jgi:hypothetical protein
MIGGNLPDLVKPWWVMPWRTSSTATVRRLGGLRTVGMGDALADITLAAHVMLACASCIPERRHDDGVFGITLRRSFLLCRYISTRTFHPSKLSAT